MILEDEKKKMIEANNSLIEYQDKLRNLFDNLEDIEKRVNSKINKFNISNFKME